MIHITKYNATTGGITSNLMLAKIEEADQNLEAGEGYVEGTYAPEEYIFEVNTGEMVPRAQTPPDTAEIDARMKRNEMLLDTDWMVLPDSPHDTPAVREYRQSLRDVTAQSGFPYEITWPVLEG